MNESSLLLSEWLAPLADATDLPLQWVLLAALLVFGLLGQGLIHWLLARLDGAAKHSKTPWDDVLVQALVRPGQWLMWLVIAYLALGVPGNLDGLRDLLRHAADTGFILLLGWFLFRFVQGIENELLSDRRGPRDSDDRAAISATARLIRICISIVVALMALQSLGVSVSGLLAFGGIGGIAVGFAARDLLANFLGGLSVYLDRPFTVGDWVRSPDREIEGTVEHIGWRMTRIRTFDQRPLYVPNAIFSNVALENPSRMNNRRIYETIGVRYADVARLADIVADVRAMLQQHPDIDLGRTLIVNFVSCGPSSLDFFIYTFTKTVNWVEYHAVKEDVLLKVLSIVESHGAEIAFPTQTLHVAGAEPLAAVSPEP